MKNGENHNYDNSAKRHARRTIWNKIAERVAVPVSDAVVLYLSGREDLDREVALEKGFQGHNLIAVDRNPKITQTIRKNGSLALCGTIQDILIAWSGTPVHVVYGDFCCGLYDSIFANFSVPLIGMPSLQGAVVAVTLLRGRDSDSNTLRAILGEKHRAAALLKAIEIQVRQTVETMNLIPFGSGRELFFREFGSFLRDYPLGYFGSYRSGLQVFDYGVWRTPHMVTFALLSSLTFRRLGFTMKDIDVSDALFTEPRWPENQKPPKIEKLSRQISAIKAHRTMRLEGTFPRT